MRFLFLPCLVLALVSSAHASNTKPPSAKEHIAYCESLLRTKKLYPLDAFAQRKLKDAAFKTQSSIIHNQVVELWLEQAVDPANPFQKEATANIKQAIEEMNLSTRVLMRLLIEPGLETSIRIEVAQFIERISAVVLESETMESEDFETMKKFEKVLNAYLRQQKGEDPVLLTSIASALGYPNYQAFLEHSPKLRNLFASHSLAAFSPLKDFSHLSGLGRLSDEIASFLITTVEIGEDPLPKRIEAIEAAAQILEKRLASGAVGTKHVLEDFVLLIQNNDMSSEMSNVMGREVPKFAPQLQDAIERAVQRLLPYGTVELIVAALEHGKSDLLIATALNQIEKIANHGVKSPTEADLRGISAIQAALEQVIITSKNKLLVNKAKSLIDAQFFITP